MSPSFRLLLLAGCLLSSRATADVALWLDPDRSPAVQLTDLQDAVAGDKLALLSTDDLIDPTVLDPARFELLILPYGGLYPAEGQAALDAFLRGGGSYLVWGGPEFGRPLFRAGDRWVPWDDFGDPLVAVEGRRAVGRPNQSDRDLLTSAGAGTVDSPYTFSVGELQSFAYGSLDLPALPPNAAGLTFSARSDGPPAPLILEARARDGSRWKQAVDVEDEWRTYRLHLGSFVAYGSEERMGPEDHLVPDELVQLQFGGTIGTWGRGARRWQVRDVRFAKAAVPADAVPAERVPASARATLERVFTTALAPHETAWPTIAGAPALAAGQPAEREATHREVFAPLSDEVRRVRGEQVGAAIHTGGPYAGSVWMRLDVDPPPQRVAELLPLLTTAPLVGQPRPIFAVVGGEPAVRFELPLIGRRRPRPVRFHGEVRLAGRTLPFDLEQTIDPGRPTSLMLPPSPFNVGEMRDCRLVGTLSDGKLDQPVTAGLDARRTLRELADFFVAEAADDAKVHGYSFVDNRGMRTLLGAYEIFGDQRYLETALNWGRAMIAEQRDDGGYRMGYGITAKGEECYVADGGEVAVTMTQLIRYAPEAERDAFRRSVDAYMDFRESFRVPTGGIGVGWCLTDYSRRPLEKLDEVTKIYAPERNIYTIGCSLAAAYAHAYLRDDPALERRAEADADWYLPRAEWLNGASLESFVYAHATTGDPARRRLYADYLREHRITRSLERQETWWTTSQGRTAYNLSGLIYYQQRIEPSPALTVEIARAGWAMFSDDSPTSFHRLIGQPSLTFAQRLYLCFGGVGLADWVQPMATLTGFERPGG